MMSAIHRLVVVLVMALLLAMASAQYGEASCSNGCRKPDGPGCRGKIPMAVSIF